MVNLLSPRDLETRQTDGNYIIPANWQTAISNCTTVGFLIGLSITGYRLERFGSKRTYICGMAVMVGFIFLPVFATSLPMWLAGNLSWVFLGGSFVSRMTSAYAENAETLTTAYATEIGPINLRGILASFVSMTQSMGLIPSMFHSW
jgi:SP family general alpha glucoside:H+ symporter-like MFS transporter